MLAALTAVGAAVGALEPLEPASPCIDILMTTKDVRDNCRLDASMKSLFRYARPRPCRVIFLAMNCESVLPPGSICIQEDSLIPNVTSSWLREYITAVRPELAYHTGWFFQQMLKLGAALHIDSLTKHYAIWDSDMVMQKPTTLFQVDERTGQYVGNLRVGPTDHKQNKKTLVHANLTTAFGKVERLLEVPQTPQSLRKKYDSKSDRSSHTW